MADVSKRGSGLLGVVETPKSPPQIPLEIVEQIEKELSPQEAPFVRHMRKCITVEWLDVEDSRLGITKFSGDHNEMYRLRRLKLPPGDITIRLHPCLVNDKALFLHTLVHELIHAAGLIEHSKAHEEWVNSIAPAPTLADSPLLQSLRAKVIGEAEQDEWLCSNCGFSFERKTIRKPKRCPKCARVLG